MSKFIVRVEHLPSLNEYEVSRRELVVKLEVLGLKSLYLWDYCYYYVSHEDWGKVFEDVLLNMPEYTVDKFDCAVAPDLAYAMGLFFADGTCGLSHNYSGANWNICNTKVELLEKCKPTLESEWPELSFRIETYPSEAKGKMTNYGMRNNALHHLQVGVKERHNDGTRGGFIEDWHHLFYLDGHKQVPAAICESSNISKKAFLEGVIAGDGNKKQPFITVNGKIGTYGLAKLMSDINWKVSRYPDKRHLGTYTMRYNRSAEDLDKMGGCENYSMLTVARVSEKYKLNSCGIAIGQSPFGYHGFNIFLSDAGLFYLEPQTGDVYPVDEDSGYKAETIILG